MSVIHFLENFNFLIFLIFTVFYAYQIFYVFVAFLKKDPRQAHVASRQHKFAAVIAARNESAVIGDLIACLKAQNYPKDKLDIFVLADNCTDDTALVSRRAGAMVYTRNNPTLVGKSWALDEVFHHIARDHGDAGYEAYFVFDADNLVDKNFVAEMNRVYDQGYRVVTSYRNSKNYGENWLTAGYALWFLREAKFLSQPRMALGTNCAINGTGFLVDARIIQENGGWIYHLLTEDIEFSVACAIKGERIGYSAKAVVYDEQPTDFRQSWRQRLRWSKGFYQVMTKYAANLLKGASSGEKRWFSCYDMFMTIAPGTLLTLLCAAVNIMFLIGSSMVPAYLTYRVVRLALFSLIRAVANFYLVIFGYGLLTTITEWKRIDAPARKKIAYLFTFPLFLFTYVPIAVCALLHKKVEWKPIVHGAPARRRSA